MSYVVPIPHIYLKITEGSQNRAELFKSYVNGYIKRSYPGYEVLKIEGMKAICGRVSK